MICELCQKKAKYVVGNSIVGLWVCELCDLSVMEQAKTDPSQLTSMIIKRVISDKNHDRTRNTKR